MKVSRTEAIWGLQAEAAPPEHIKASSQVPGQGKVPHRKNVLQGPPTGGVLRNLARREEQGQEPGSFSDWISVLEYQNQNQSPSDWWSLGEKKARERWSPLYLLLSITVIRHRAQENVF